ncbi:MAG: hypothetical protein EBS19_03765 [Spirochaetia bacterium]|nr:hypothetical protein [Spirochaetia bacterium]
MNSKTIFKKHLLWNTYNPKNFKFLFFNHKGEATLKKQNWDSFYEFIKSFFICNCKIKFKNSVLNCKKVEFHEKFGWVLSHNLVYIFLGKLDISDTRLFLTIGRNSYLSGDSLISGFGKVNIGSFTCIGEHFHAIIGNDSHSFQKVGYINFSENERLIYEGLMFGKKKKPLPGFILIGNNRLLVSRT